MEVVLNSVIRGIYPYRDEYKVVDIFGYCTKGLPGIEIIGLGKLNRSIKEKFIYLSRLQMLKLPLKRYVLCVETDQEVRESSMSNFRWLEFPLLILFWSLAGYLKMGRLDNCFSSGKVSVNGRIATFELSNEKFHLLKNEGIFDGESWKYIAPIRTRIPENCYHLASESLFENLEKVSF